MKNQIGNKIKDLRKKQNLTQEQLAEQLNVSAQAVSKWENGTNLPDITVLPELADCFGVTIDELMGYRHNEEARLWDILRSEEYRSLSGLDKCAKLIMFQKKYPTNMEVATSIASNIACLDVSDETKTVYLEQIFKCVLKYTHNPDTINILVAYLMTVCSEKRAYELWEYIPKAKLGDLYERRYLYQGDKESLYIQRYKNNAQLIENFIHRHPIITEDEIAWYSEVIRILESLGDDGQVPAAWYGHYLLYNLSLSHSYIMQDEITEGIRTLDYILDFYEDKIMKVKNGDILPLGKKVFFGSLTKTALAVFEEIERQDLCTYFTHNEPDFVQGHYIGPPILIPESIYEYMTQWSGFKKLADNQEFKKRLERVKNLKEV
ncbi:MAG: helix-turn-helix transcriptional regulator [Ruminococcaceae bacterium]|nr:helix-turn-helix transcriptional regulator [Oscillospiraceae bacterium]